MIGRCCIRRRLSGSRYLLNAGKGSRIEQIGTDLNGSGFALLPVFPPSWPRNSKLIKKRKTCLNKETGFFHLSFTFLFEFIGKTYTEYFLELRLRAGADLDVVLVEGGDGNIVVVKHLNE